MRCVAPAIRIHTSTLISVDHSLGTRNIIASAAMEGVELSEQTISDLQAIEAGTKTAEHAIAEYFESRNLASGR